MVRSFHPTPVPADALARVLRAALRSPSAGNTQATDLVVLAGPAETDRYWDAALPEERRAAFAFPGLLRAPVLVLPVAHPDAYVARYGEPDKAVSGLTSTERWPVPYWYVDAAFAAMLVQLAAIDAGLGVLFFGLFDRVGAVCESLGIPAGRVPIGTVALGYHDPAGDRPGRSAGRARRGLDDVVHRGGW